MVKDIIITVETFLLIVITFWAVTFTVMAIDLAKNDCAIYKWRNNYEERNENYIK